MGGSLKTVIDVLAFFVIAGCTLLLAVIWALYVIRPKGNTHRLWSIWQRDRIAVKNDTFFGKSTTKDVQGNVVAVFCWAGNVAIGWYKPVSLVAVENAGMAAETSMSSMTPTIKRNV